MGSSFSFVLSSSSVFIIAFAIGCTSPSRQAAEPVSPVVGGVLQYAPHAVNSEESMKKPYLVMVSIDGYRHDYNQLFSPPNLSRLASEGVRAESLKPVYPSKTFPNHYTLVTGLQASRHGIVSNEFYDPSRNAVYSLPDRKAVEDGSWYFGEPLWITAGKQGMLSASYFWVGSEADIGGGHPNYYLRYDSDAVYETRVDQVLAWLKLPAAQRPHFITLYFEAVDSASHRYGVHSKETREAVLKVDKMIGRLREGLRATGLDVNLIVVSDHGMQDVDAKKMIVIDETPAAAKVLAKFRALGRGPQMLLYLNQGEPLTTIDEAQKVLSKNAKNFRVWKRSQLTRFDYASSPRAGDLIVEPDLPYSVGFKAHMPSATGANHGWDPVKNKSMHGILFAAGPAFKEGMKIPTLDNIHVYPLALETLGLKQRVPVDGQLDAVRSILK